MELILLERVEKLGRIGDIVNVRPGYARNFLLPRGKALRASEANRRRFEENRAQIEAENETRRETAAEEAKSLKGKSLVLVRQASNTGQLYGSVSARDLADALEEDGAKVAKSQIVLDRPIKTIGLYEVRVVLHPEVDVTVSVNVARSPEEAELQARGVDVTAEMFEREASGFTEEVGEEAASAETDAEEAEAEAEPS
jgi:large subunit ribosomal protein L9